MEDIFRKKWKPVSENLFVKIMDIKEKAEDLHKSFGDLKNREMSLAITNLEQSVMWAIKAIT